MLLDCNHCRLRSLIWHVCICQHYEYSSKKIVLHHSKYHLLSADHFVAVVFGGQDSQTGLDNSTSKSQHQVESRLWNMEGKQVKYRFLNHARLCSIFMSIQQYTKVLLKKWRDNLVSYPVQMMVTFKDSTNATLIAMYDPVRWTFCNYVDSIIKVVKWKTSLI